jgi:hypothetical protein
MILTKFITKRESHLVVVALFLFLLAALFGSLVLGITTLPSYATQIKGFNLDIRGPAAGLRGWPSSTPHEQPWDTPIYWNRTTRFGQWQYSVHAADSEKPTQRSYGMRLSQSGWPLPVIERKQMSWKRDTPSLEGPEQDPPASLLYGNLLLDALILGGGLWLAVFGPVSIFVIWRRISRTLQGHCTFCGYDMTGFEQCPECGWRATGSTPSGPEDSSG